MKSKVVTSRWGLVSLIAVSFLFVGCGKKSSDDADHHHADHGHNYVIPKTKFKADKDLEERMAKLYQSMLVLHEDNADMQKAANDIQATVNDIFATCKLEPEPDQALHPILENMMQAAKMLKDNKALEAMDIMHGALGAYNDSFTPGLW